MTHSPADIAALLQQHGLSPSRSLGQNFVADPNTVRRIARLANLSSTDHVVEIGAGLGSLTLALVETGAAVTAIEVDKYILPVLREVVEPKGVRVVAGDASALDWNALLGGTPHVLVANLPYNVATPMVMDLLSDTPLITKMLVMVQREVGERMAATPGSKAYGAVSVKVAYAGVATVVGIVPPTVFIPKPRVDSALVQIVRHAHQSVDVERSVLFDVVESGFAQRRKMLRSALRPLMGDHVEDVLSAAGIDSARRGETLELAEFVAVATAWSGVRQTERRD